MCLSSGGNQLFIAEASSRQPPAVKSKAANSQRLNHRLAMSAGQMIGQTGRYVGKIGNTTSEQEPRAFLQTEQNKRDMQH